MVIKPGGALEESGRAGSSALEALLDNGEFAPNQDQAIPDIVIRRLPIYLRTLDALMARGVTSINSEELAEAIGVTAAQIRRDLSYFGKFGKQGKGYDVRLLN